VINENIVISKATRRDTDDIMVVIEEARESIGRLGIDQWQYGYPNREVVLKDIDAGVSFIARDKDTGALCGTFAAIGSDPSYENIFEGAWLTDGSYIALHRFCVARAYRGMGVSDTIIGYLKEYCAEHGIGSLRVDTHHGNYPMIRMLERAGIHPLRRCLSPQRRASCGIRASDSGLICLT